MAKQRVRVCATALSAAVLAALSACSGEGFYNADPASQGDGAFAPQAFAARSDFAGIYHGTAGSASTSSSYFSYARLFVASNGTAIFYAADGNEYAYPATAREEFAAFSFGAKQAAFGSGGASLTMDADGFSYDSSANSPNPRDSGATSIIGSVTTSTAIEDYAKITGTSISGPGNLGLLENTVNLTNVAGDEAISVTLSTLASLAWRSIGSLDVFGFASNQLNIGDRWEITADTSGNVTVIVTEGSTPSGCSITNGVFALIDASHNEFAVSFDLSCSDTTLNGAYSGSGFLAQTVTLGATYDMAFAVQDGATASKYLFFYGSGY